MFLFSASGCQNYSDSQQDPNITSQVQKRAWVNRSSRLRTVDVPKDSSAVCLPCPLPELGEAFIFYEYTVFFFIRLTSLTWLKAQKSNTSDLQSNKKNYQANIYLKNLLI